MGEAHRTRVDVAALRAVARQYDVAADLVDTAVRMHLSRLMFDGATAGRVHTASGDALRVAVDDTADQLRRWARSATEIAAVLRLSADRYAETDARAAVRIG